MTPNKYISIRSVLYDIASTIPEDMWDEGKFMEWATKALHKLKFESKLEQNVGLIRIEDHKATMLPEAMYLVQAAYRDDKDPEMLLQQMRQIMGIDSNAGSLEDNLRLPAAAVFTTQGWKENKWERMRMSTNSFIKAVSDIPGLDFKNLKCFECMHEMTIDSTGCITTTLKNGWLLVSYLSYPIDSCGDALIPDHEDLKEALMHYVYYRIYLAKTFMHEQNSNNERDYHLSRFQILGMKAVSDLNSPSLGVMENMKNYYNRIIPRENQADSFYSQLNAPELQLFI